MNYLCENIVKMHRAIYTVREIMNETSFNIRFAYAGSCAMFLHGIPLNREIHDVDIIVSDQYLCSLWTERLLTSKHLKTRIGKYPDGMVIKVQHVNCPTIRIDVMFVKDFDKKVETIGHPLIYASVVTLDNLVEVKARWNRPKDKKDIQRIALFKMMQSI